MNRSTLIGAALISALILSVMAGAFGSLSVTEARQPEKVYPEQLLLELIEEKGLEVNSQVLALLQQAAALRGVDDKTADKLAAEAFQLMSASNDISKGCVCLLRLAHSYNNTVNMLFKLINNIKQRFNITDSETLEQAQALLEDAAYNIDKAIEAIHASNGSCDNATFTLVKEYLQKARQDIQLAREMIDSITSCHFKDIIVKILYHRIIDIDRAIQKLAFQKAELESRGMRLPARHLEKSIEKLSAKDDQLKELLEEINSTEYCINVWTFVTAVKMIHHYESIETNIAAHLKDKSQLMIRSEIKTIMVAQKLVTASNIIETISQNTEGLSEDTKGKLSVISSNIDDIVALYKQMVAETWSGSENLNATISELTTKINETRNLIREVINEIPKHGYGQTISLLKSVDNILGEVENSITKMTMTLEQVHAKIRIARHISLNIHVRTIMKDLQVASIVANRACENSSIASQLELGKTMLETALENNNDTATLETLNEVLNIVLSAENEASGNCSNMGIILKIIEMEIETTLSVFS